LESNYKGNLYDLDNLPYIDAVIYESMRIYPILSLNRELLEDVVIGDYIIPKGSNIQASPYSIGLNPEVWEDPYVFRPQRFLDKNMKDLQYTVLSFGFGPRVCPGRPVALFELKLLIALICRSFIVVPREGSIVELDTISYLHLSPKESIYVTFKSR